MFGLSYIRTTGLEVQQTSGNLMRMFLCEVQNQRIVERSCLET